MHSCSVTLRDVPSFGYPLSLASSPSPQKGHPCKRSSSSRPLSGSRSHPAHSTARLALSLRRHIAQLARQECFMPLTCSSLVLRHPINRSAMTGFALLPFVRERRSTPELHADASA